MSAHTQNGGTGQPAATTDELARVRDEVIQLRRENRRYAREVESLRAGAKMVVDELDTHLLAKEVARLAARLLHGERALVVLLADDEITAQEAFGNPPPTPDQGLVGWMMQHRRALVWNGPGSDQRANALFAAQAYRNTLCVPILNHQRHLLGFIEVCDRVEGGWFTADDQRVAEVLALQAAIGFSRARLFDQMQEWTKSLEMLLSFNAAINQHLDPPLLVRHLVENAARFLEADGGMAGLAVRANRTDEMELYAEGYWNRGSWHEMERRWARHEGLPGQLVESEFPYIANEYREDRLVDATLAAQFDIRRALCVPIKDSADQLLGFFELHKGADRAPFTWQDAAFLESLANTTAVAIKNAQLLKALELRGSEIRALWALHVTRLEEERRHVARELHDEAGQALIAIKLGLQVLERQVPEALPELRAELHHLREQVNDSTAQLQDLAKRLRPSTLDQLGLDVALRQLATDHQDRTGMTVHLSLSSLGVGLPAGTEIALYRIAQEALTNAAKHADASQVWIALHEIGERIVCVISDDGRGFDAAAPHPGLGLIGIKERADLLGGAVEVWSRKGEGARITVRVPAQ